MPLEEKEHKCKEFPKGYTDLKIKFFKEAINGWNWNLMVEEGMESLTKTSGIWECYHIKFCPFCGEELDK